MQHPPRPHVHSHAHAGDACNCSLGSADVRDDFLVAARDLWLARGGRDLIAGVDLEVGPREIVTLIGPNGAGKTTLVRLLLGAEIADRGAVMRRSGIVIGYVPQRFDVDQAIPMTVEDFLALGGSPRHEERLAILREVGAEQTASQQLSKLSGGELQRVLMARALIRRPDLLILDEPASGVDFGGEAELYELIGRLRDDRGLGILLVSHDLHVVMAKSDRVLCLNGHICCSGKPEAVSQHPEYARIFGARGAATLGVYRHHHDHAHDLSGAPHPRAEAPEPRGR